MEKNQLTRAQKRGPPRFFEGQQVLEKDSLFGPTWNLAYVMRAHPVLVVSSREIIQ